MSPWGSCMLGGDTTCLLTFPLLPMSTQSLQLSPVSLQLSQGSLWLSPWSLRLSSDLYALALLSRPV